MVAILGGKREFIQPFRGSCISVAPVIACGGGPVRSKRVQAQITLELLPLFCLNFRLCRFRRKWKSLESEPPCAYDSRDATASPAAGRAFCNHLCV